MRPPKRKIAKCSICGKGMFWWAGRPPKYCPTCYREYRRRLERQRWGRRVAAKRQQEGAAS